MPPSVPQEKDPRLALPQSAKKPSHKKKKPAIMIPVCQQLSGSGLVYGGRRKAINTERQDPDRSGNQRTMPQIQMDLFYSCKQKGASDNQPDQFTPGIDTSKKYSGKNTAPPGSLNKYRIGFLDARQAVSATAAGKYSPKKGVLPTRKAKRNSSAACSNLVPLRGLL